MIISKKIRLKPTPEQTTQLYKSAGTARWAYNWALQRQQENYNSGGKFLSDNILRKEITQLKKQDEFQWLNDVSNNVPKQAVKDACNAFKSFFKGETKHPKFKTKRHSKLSFYNDNGKLKSKSNCILIEKVGWVKTAEQVPNVKYYNPRISFNDKYWYLSFGIEVEFEKRTFNRHNSRN
jgi:putative transposase